MQSARTTPHTTRHRTSAQQHQRPAAPTIAPRNATTPSVSYARPYSPAQALYLNIHKRDTKRDRFGQDPPRGYHTRPTSPSLSRSVEDRNNPSPYDSGYDSAYSNASGPGHPPSSHGNPDMDDHVERYLHVQRVATLTVEDLPPSHRLNTACSGHPSTTPRSRSNPPQNSNLPSTPRQPTSHSPNQPSSPVDSIPRHAVRRGPPRPLPPATHHTEPSSRAYTATPDHDAHRLHHQTQPQATATTYQPHPLQCQLSSTHPATKMTTSTVIQRYPTTPEMQSTAATQGCRTKFPPSHPASRHTISASPPTTPTLHTPIYPDESDEENISPNWPERTASSPPRIADPDSTVISTVNLTQWSLIS
jgi:hypothetical protein